MQAVRLARYHTGRSHLVQFSGAYHGWWDGVQPGVGNPGKMGDLYLLKEMNHTMAMMQQYGLLKTPVDLSKRVFTP